MTKLLHIALRDVRILARSRGAMILLLAFPSVLILILGMAFGGLAGGSGMGGIPVAIVNLDRGNVGSDITSALAGDPELGRIVEVAVRTDEEAVRAEVARGDLTAALIVPADFSAAIESGTPVALEVIKDPGSDIAANVWEGVVRSVATKVSGTSVAVRTGIAATARGMQFLETTQGFQALTANAVRYAGEEGSAPIVTVRTAETAQTHKLTALDYYAGSMTSMFLLFGCMYGAFSFVDERESRTFSRMLVSPTPRAAIVAGKLLAVGLLGAGQFVVLHVFTRLTLRANWGSDPLGLALVVAGELVGVVGLTALIASVARTRRSVGGIAPVAVQLLALIGGAFFPMTVFPAWLRPVQYLSFVGWAMDGFVKLQNGATAAMVLPHFAVPAAIGAALFAFGVMRMRAD